MGGGGVERGREWKCEMKYIASPWECEDSNVKETKGNTLLKGMKETSNLALQFSQCMRQRFTDQLSPRPLHVYWGWSKAKFLFTLLTEGKMAQTNCCKKELCWRR